MAGIVNGAHDFTVAVSNDRSALNPPQIYPF
jgi:hypothetical protein